MFFHRVLIIHKSYNLGNWYRVDVSVHVHVHVVQYRTYLQLIRTGYVGYPINWFLTRPQYTELILREGRKKQH